MNKINNILSYRNFNKLKFRQPFLQSRIGIGQERAGPDRQKIPIRPSPSLYGPYIKTTLLRGLGCPKEDSTRGESQVPIWVSVVIPTKNAGPEFEDLLVGIFSQKVGFDFEVICVDSGSKDRTLEICRRYPVEVFVINENDFNHGLTRNFGISKAKGEFVILMSQDVIPYNEYWMVHLIRALQEDDKVAGVYSRQIPREDADILTKRDINGHLTARKEKVTSFIQNRKEYESLKPREKYIFCNFDNVCSCIRSSVWEKLPFAETDFGEDIDWSKKVLEAGYKIIYEPESAVIHSHNGSFLQQYRRAYIHHKRLYELFKFRPVPTWRKAGLFYICNILKDGYYILRNEKLSAKLLQELLSLPLSSFLKILGQYRGAVETYENRTSNP